MARPTYAKKADIPPGFEEEYEEQDGKFVPIDQTAKLEAALEKERKAREAAEASARKSAKEAAELAAKKAADAAGMGSDELKAAYKRIEDSIREELRPQLEEAVTLKAENRKLKLQDVVTGEFRKQGALPQRLGDFWKMHGDEFDLTADGKPMVKAEPGKDIAKHVGAVMKQRPEWVTGTKAAGGGAAGLQPTGAGAGGSGDGGKVTFDDVVKNPASAIAQANEQ